MAEGHWEALLFKLAIHPDYITDAVPPDAAGVYFSLHWLPNNRSDEGCYVFVTESRVSVHEIVHGTRRKR